MNIKIWVGSLAQYNSGRLVGGWVTLPMDESELEERILSLVGHDEEYGVIEYESPFSLSQYANISNLNELMKKIQGLEEDENVIKAVLDNWHDNDEAIEILSTGDYVIYSNCDNMGDVAHQWLDETGGLSSIPEQFRNYFDFDAFGRDMALNGTFLRYTDSETGKAGYVQILN